MGVLTSIKRVWLIVSISLLAFVVTANVWSADGAFTAQWTFEGRVYEGDVGGETRPLQAVIISVYGASNPYPDPGTFIRDTWTNINGWYGLTVSDADGLFDYYSIRASDLNDYVSVGASTVGGVVRTENWIEYAAPLTGKTLTGNKFWDRAPVLSGRVFAGTIGDESTPLSAVTVTLYCASNQYPDIGSALVSAITDATGWYGLSTYKVGGLCDYYRIAESDPLSYFSVGATSVSGVIREDNWIEYAAPYATKTLTGNKFWDDTNKVYMPLLMKNY